MGIDALGCGATSHRKPRSKPRSLDDSAYITAFSKRRIVVEHTINRLRRFQALAQADRHHPHHHTARVRAVAALVNRQTQTRLPA